MQHLSHNIGKHYPKRKIHNCLFKGHYRHEKLEINYRRRKQLAMIKESKNGNVN